MMHNGKFLISIVGPTAIGKTSLSIKLAQYYNTEIISADSRQFFKEMRIGTAAPTKEELKAAKHHFIHHISIEDEYNVGSFERDALSKLENLFDKYNIVIMVGGSGLYVDAVTKGLDNFPDIDPKIREDLNKQLATSGLESLQKQLQKLDPKSYQNIAIDNPHRVIRALEICLGTNKPYSSFLNKKESKRPFKTIHVGLTADRNIIYDRINQRVDLMMSLGLLEEVKSLESKKHLNALNTVGYKELFIFLEGAWTKEFAISEIKKNSRRFAKRQLTWFKKNESTIWFDYETPLHEIVNTIDNKLNNHEIS
ncbi:tRNA (adenosine(37)-N6)-dimethylallyltransferase MiaA [Mangrovimonas futianensis]|uniref:tRNA (adenosine(37)-N6)-dimethylallyltransferase MiaA n=1 Tax=Mangrovimonas futianensis TaxID=2895523 RepID=UPI001E47D847|nr:tRNA (adenosine(37)-N6)-dimethylallyltransferase MiaA [Mangrovimonas futianensis]MCF1422704.1 tRNA (adenosine(37)-N6)-dimethylallyltransferase MiaA [Mangrovimonas futianensis]